MYEIKIISDFAAAHQLREYGGECENLHGHNWKIEVYVIGEKLGDDGLLIDFRVIKNATEMVIRELDHAFLNDLEYFKNINPSSENIARFIFESLKREINHENARICKVSAWESDSACASYVES